MTEVEKIILNKLDQIGADVKETKQIATEARQMAMEAKEAALEAKRVAMEAKQMAMEAKQEAREAKEAALEAKQEAAEAKMIALEAKNKACEAAEAAEKVNSKIIDLRFILENEISRKIDVIGEGHDFVKMNMEKALGMEKEREKMWLEILNLKLDVKELKKRVYIA